MRRGRHGVGPARLLAPALLAVLASAALACGVGADAPPAPGDEVLNAASPEQLGSRLLARFEQTLDLDRMSVHVAKTHDLPFGLRFEYFTPAGDKSFLIHVERTAEGWRADREDVRSIERRFAR